MTAMLRVLAIVALVATASADTKVVEFSEKALTDLRLSYPDYKPFAAKLINPDIEMQFLEDAELRNLPQNAANLAPYSYLTPELESDKQHKDCGSYLGVELPETNQVFCNITSVSLAQIPNKNPDGPPELYVILDFYTEPNVELILDIPIFKTPAECPQEHDDLRAWAAEKKVGVDSLINVDFFELIQKGRPINIDFSWLNELLKYGIMREYTPFYRYVSRPIILPGDIIEKLITTIETFNEI